MNKDAAKESKLPISVVARQKGWPRSQGYFDFVLFVESTYLANMTLEMMMAYVEGDLVHEIKSAMILSDVVTSKFDRLFDDDDTLNCDNKNEILKYVLERYASMRGTYFVKHLKGNSKGRIDKPVASQATQARVIN